MRMRVFTLGAEKFWPDYSLGRLTRKGCGLRVRPESGVWPRSAASLPPLQPT